ncbi:MAG: glucosaminidase domain-containing protein [Bacillus sp. (in: Bacteria)]|nr:glucosaminidase domain-containing protein [Bacillus sp. (in: firmicutes)]
MGTNNLNVRFEPNTRIASIGTLRLGDTVTIIGTERDTNLSMDRTWYAILFNHGEHWQFARPADIRRNVDPNGMNLTPDHRDMYQFLVLSESSGVSVEYLNQELVGKGILENKGEAFEEAGTRHRVNEFYLLSHAFLETGHGIRSPLADGRIQVGKIHDHKFVSIAPEGTFIAERDPITRAWTSIEKVEDFDLKQANNIRKTYNMFGIGAIDACPHVCGSIRAYEEEWFSADSAIVGGAGFIAQRYVHNSVHQQNTLYKMRWNPNNPGLHQYATDIGWASKQTSMLFRHYQNLPHLRKTFDIPRFN